MELSFPDGMDRALATNMVRRGMADVEISEDYLTAVIIADYLPAAVAEILGRSDTLIDGAESGGKSIPAPSDVGVRTTVLMPGGPFRAWLNEAAQNADRLTNDAKMVHYLFS
jgi:hypothetical protein